jgi:hypothetical protein
MTKTLPTNAGAGDPSRRAAWGKGSPASWFCRRIAVPTRLRFNLAHAMCRWTRGLTNA